MTDRITKSFKDQAIWGKVITVFFFAGIVISAFVLFMLPHNLVYKGQVANVDGAWPVFVPLFLSIAITFIIGIGAVVIAILNKKEVVVYLEKKENTSTEGTAGTEGSGDTDLVKAFRAAIEQGKNDKEVLQQGLNSICKQLDAGQGAVYVAKQNEDKRVLELQSGYALNMAESNKIQFEFGEGLVGQSALSGQSLYIDDVPDGYITILSGLGSASPKYLNLAVIKKGTEAKGVLELATFAPLKADVRKQIDEMAGLLAEKIG